MIFFLILYRHLWTICTTETAHFLRHGNTSKLPNNNSQNRTNLISKQLRIDISSPRLTKPSSTLITINSTLARILNASLILSMRSTTQDSNEKITISIILRNLATCLSWIRVLPPTHNSRMWIAQAQAIISTTRIRAKEIEAMAMATISRNSNKLRQ